VQKLTAFGFDTTPLAAYLVQSKQQMQQAAEQSLSLMT
jgi:hypothetical protein